MIRGGYWQALVLILALWPGIGAAFEDDESCLMCHKYPKMGRMTEEGVQKSYYVMPNTFSRTVHRNVPCRDCHSYIKELPHRPVETGVQCDSECHSVQNPSTGRPFSHKPIYNVYKESVHARKKVEDDLDADKPYCITCHTNPLYNPDEKEAPKHIVDRCVACHEDEAFARKWYNHTSRRIREVKRSPREVVALCSTCHGDQELIDRHLKAAEKEGRELGEKFEIAAESYKDSFHGKVTKYGGMKSANCLDCHASQEDYYVSVHALRPSRDPESPVHEDNRVNTCRQCHETADENYAALDPHPGSGKKDNEFKHYAEMVYNIVGDTALVVLVGLAAFETIGRRRDGAGWRFVKGTSWWRRRRRGL